MMTHHADSTAGALVLIVSVDKNGFDEPHLLSFFNSIACRGVARTDDGHALTVAPLLQEARHVVKGLYRLHRLFV